MKSLYQTLNESVYAQSPQIEFYVNKLYKSILNFPKGVNDALLWDHIRRYNANESNVANVVNDLINKNDIVAQLLQRIDEMTPSYRKFSLSFVDYKKLTNEKLHIESIIDEFEKYASGVMDCSSNMSMIIGKTAKTLDWNNKNLLFAFYESKLDSHTYTFSIELDDARLMTSVWIPEIKRVLPSSCSMSVSRDNTTIFIQFK